MVGERRRGEIGFCSLDERLDAATPGVVFHVSAESETTPPYGTRFVGPVRAVSVASTSRAGRSGR